ncbi:hypothetical protein [Modestobacter sp. URMC 112]
MTAVPLGSAPAAAVHPPPAVAAGVRQRRLLRLAGALTRAAAGLLRAPLTGTRGRRRLLVCGAARVLSALDVRVEVRPSPAAWPRTGPGHLVVVADRVGWLDGLALLTSVPGLPVATPEVAGWPLVGRLARAAGVAVLDPGGRVTLPWATADPAAPICPVEVHARVSAPAAGRLSWRGLADVVAAPGVVVAVRLRSPLDRAPAGRLAVDVES